VQITSNSGRGVSSQRSDDTQLDIDSTGRSCRGWQSTVTRYSDGCGRTAYVGGTQCASTSRRKPYFSVLYNCFVLIFDTGSTRSVVGATRWCSCWKLVGRRLQRGRCCAREGVGWSNMPTMSPDVNGFTQLGECRSWPSTKAVGGCEAHEAVKAAVGSRGNL